MKQPCGTWLCAITLWLASLLPVGQSSTLHAVSFEPEIDAGGRVQQLEAPVVEPLRRGGELNDTASKPQSQFVHIGCFSAPNSITRDSEQEGSFDPNACVKVCIQRYPNTPVRNLIAAVKGPRCGCSTDMLDFQESAQSSCTIPCKRFLNPICGGPPDYWGVFKQYDYMTLATTGAYDPWRYVFFSVVAILEQTIRGIPRGTAVLDPDLQLEPERYYLHATDTQTGGAAFEYQVPLPGIVHGLRYDLDSSRLVGLLTSQSTGRRIRTSDWVYNLFVIDINATTKLYPRVTYSNEPPEIRLGQDMSKEYLIFSGHSAILSKTGWDMFVFTQAQATAMLKNTKSRVYFVSVPDAEVIYEAPLDFVILQLMSNEKYGDVSAIGYRNGDQQIVKLARVYRDLVEDKKKVEWIYNPAQILHILPPNDFADFWIQPGLGCSDHLFNKSLVIYRNYSNDYLQNRTPESHAMRLMEVNIRDSSTPYTDWCNQAAGCTGVLNYRVPFASIYNREPRIPLSLAAPTLISARFTMEAVRINVKFDRSTLRGALPIDTNNDIVPDLIDYGTQLSGEWDCGEIFDAATVALLGKAPPDGETTCQWTADDEIAINLPRDFIIEVGDSVFLNPDRVYTIPRPQDNEYSMAASGGILVSLPYPLDAPFIQLSGNREVDECGSVQLSAVDSRNLGGRATFNWTLAGQTDMMNNPLGRRWNTTKLTLLEASLRNATLANGGDLYIPADRMEAAAQYDIVLSVTSRWGLTTNQTIKVTKLDYAAPVVDILGNASRTVKRTQRVDILARGSSSQCANVDRSLTYRWTETTGQLNFIDYPNIPTSTKSLIIPAFTLEPTGVGADLNRYNFTVATFVPSSPNQAAYASIQILVERSPVYVQLALEDRTMTRGRVMILDARESQDPDYPTAAGHTFKGTFRWWCLTPLRDPCFGFEFDGLMPELQTCQTDINKKLRSGGETFSAPVFGDTPFCRWARGVLMVNTSNFTEGEYIFTAEIEATDGRTAQKDVRITITNLEVPEIFLEMQEQKPRYPTTSQIGIKGTVETALDPTVNIVFSWRIYSYGTNPAYDADLAREAEANGLPYRVDKMIYLDQTNFYDISNNSRFFHRPDSTNLLIYENVLQPSKKMKVRLIITVGDGLLEGFAEVGFETDGLPPRSGRLLCSPLNATVETARLISAPDWVADDLPLSYTFGYIDFLGNQEILMKFNTAPVEVSRITVAPSEFPLGEPSTNFTLLVYVDVVTPFGSKTTEVITVQSLPPADSTQYVQNMLSQATNTDPETAVNNIKTALTVLNAPTPPSGVPPSPQDEAVMNQALSILETVVNEIPVTEETTLTQALVINKVIQAGVKNERAMTAVENMVVNAGNANLYNVNNPSVVTASLFALGEILPDENSIAQIMARGQSTGMSVLNRYRHGDLQLQPGGEQLPEEVRDVLVTVFDRRDENHVLPRGGGVITDCRGGYCDVPFLVCAKSSSNGETLFFTCCDAPNAPTGCESPPCWFRGGRCPRAPASPAASQERRLDLGQRQPSQWDWRWSSDLGYSSLFAANASAAEGGEEGPWGGGGAPARALQGGVLANASQQLGRLYQQLETDELPLLRDVQAAIRRREMIKEQEAKAQARREAQYAMMPTWQSISTKQSDQAATARAADRKMEAERQVSAIITRVAVLRDTICKLFIASIPTVGQPYSFSIPAFMIYMGKTRDMNEVSSSFRFPDKFTVPPTTPESNAFAYLYLEYRKNIYGWSTSSPPGNETRIITLIVMRSTTADIQVRNETQPIRVFADMTVFSSGLCMYWDRFSPGTAGGAWSTQGLLNNGNGCLTTHLSDIGLFIDGRAPDVIRVSNAVSYYLDETVDVGSNFSQMAILGIILFLGTLMAVWGYIQDEMVRDAQRTGKAPKRTFHLAGDGVTTPKNIEDPIAYKFAERREMFLALTFWHVLLRDHALLGPILYHEVYTRPQRIMCLGVLVTGVLALNAAFYGMNENAKLVSTGQFFPCGALSGLLVFPLFSGFVFMFTHRPSMLKRRLTKRQASMESHEAIAKVRTDIEKKSAKMPPPGYVQLPALPTLAAPTIGHQTLLALPPPSLPSLPPPAPGFPALVGPLALPVAGLPATGLPALPGLPGLPPLPKLSAANPALGQLPPPPRYRSRTPGMTPPMLTGGTPPMAKTPPRALAPGTQPLPPPPPPGGFRNAVTNDGPKPWELPDGEAQAALPGQLAAEAQHGASPPSPAGSAAAAPDAEESAAPAERQAEAEHQMAPPPPPLPPLSGPPPGMPGSGGNTPPMPSAAPLLPGRTSTPGATPPARTPPMPPLPGEFGTPRTPAQASTPGSFQVATPLGLPALVPQVQGVTRGIVHRGEPPNVLPPPFKPPMPAPPPTIPPMPGLALGSVPSGMAASFSMLGRPGGPPGGGVPPPPPPPPPPREDDPTFVRRVRLAYMDRAQQQHASELLEEGQETAKAIPGWVFTAMLVIPYVGCAVSIALNIVVDLVYSVKFGRLEEQNWYRSCAIGLSLSLFILEVIRCAITTIVELRKFEIRRGQAGGDFLRSRIKKIGGNDEPALQRRKPPPRRPPIPNVGTRVPLSRPAPPPPPPPPGNASVSRPSFLPQEGPPGVGPGVPPLRSGSGQLPVGAPPPPPGNALPSGMVPPINIRGQSTPVTSARGGGTPLGTPGGPSLLPGRLDGTPGGTPLGTPGRNPMLPGRLSGTMGSSHSLGPGPPPPPPMPGAASSGGPAGLLTREAQEKLKAAAARRGEAQPPSPAAGMLGGSRAPSHPGSRPPSHRSSGTPPKPPTPPPQGTLQQKRAQARAQQQA